MSIPTSSRTFFGVADVESRELRSLRQQIEQAAAAERSHTAEMREMAIQARLVCGMHCPHSHCPRSNYSDFSSNLEPMHCDCHCFVYQLKNLWKEGFSFL